MEDKNDFGLPESIIEAFTNGDCWALATILAKRLDAVIVTAQADDDWVHVGVLLPNDAVLDIQGVSDVQDWLDAWLDGEEGEEHYAREWSTKKFERKCVKWGMERIYGEDPKIWAERVLAAYTPMV